MKKRWKILLALVLLCGIGAWYGDRNLKAVGHPGLGTFLSQWWNNWPKSFAMDPPTIALEVKDAGMSQLEAVVDSARRRGVIMPEGNDYVKGKFTVNGLETKCKLRIKGKLNDHVKDEKWSFRVIAKGDGGFLGMKRFSLQHPGTRNYLCDWFYHQLSKGEGIVALRYGFCKVSLNGDNLGVYAYEEHFGPELLENNGRLKGPLVRFDPGLYWVHRLNGMQDRDFEEAYADYQAAALDAFDSEDLVNDPEQMRYFKEALLLMDGFRSGRLSAAQVFDIRKMAKRHAIIDLVGGHHSMDWSDVKFYYDPGAQRLEPVSYESFSAFPTKKLAGSGKFTGKSNAGAELHDALFNDADFFAAYVHELEHVSRAEYLDSTFAAIAGALDTASATLYGEFPYKELDRSIYYKNQDIIRRSLNVPKAVHAYLEYVRHGSVVVGLDAINSLPIQVVGLRMPDGTMFKPVEPVVVNARRAGGLGSRQSVEFMVGTQQDSVLHTMKLVSSVLGSSRSMETAVFPTAHLVEGPMNDDLPLTGQGDAGAEFLIYNDSARTVHIKTGHWRMSQETLVIPEGYTVYAIAPLRIDMFNGSAIVSRSPLHWTGADESPIVIASPDTSSDGIRVVGAKGSSVLRHVDLLHLTPLQAEQRIRGDLSFHNSNVELMNCRFRGTANTLLDISIGNTTITGCTFNGGSDQLELHHVRGQVSDSRFVGATDDAVSIEGGVLDMKDCVVIGAKGIGAKASAMAMLKMSDVRMTNVGQGIEVRAGCTANAEGGSIDAAHVAVVANKATMRDGAARAVLDGMKLTAKETPTVCGEGSSIVVDGKEVGATKSVEAQAETEE
ncbi:MAG: CotH kinase family protein [Flavobacteriales bacterium]|nr:CotH kinase family protein [Flavobacteriales bacterium]